MTLRSMFVDVAILGGGPCGLGAALRLETHRTRTGSARSYVLIDAHKELGGWASSVVTAEGFTFDFGGHVLFPHRHYQVFADFLAELEQEWHYSIPIRGVWINNQLVPYPLQNNIHRLGIKMQLRCLLGLVAARAKKTVTPYRDSSTRTLRAYLRSEFGAAMSALVMEPLNKKMWAYPSNLLASSWVERKSGSDRKNIEEVALIKLFMNMIVRKDMPGWTRDTRVAYPLVGGTGSIWRRASEGIPKANLFLGRSLVAVDTSGHILELSDGTVVRYGSLISSIPLDELLAATNDCPEIALFGRRLLYSRAHLVGFGIEGQPPLSLKDVHSFHVPQGDVPFWRVSFPRSFSPGNVPDPHRYWSILCEVSEPSKGGPGHAVANLDSVETSLRKLDILPLEQRIVSHWYKTVEHGYPTPFYERDQVLRPIISALQDRRIFSRGRFGGWRYEISNQDHAFMQGAEVVDFLLHGDREVTYAA
jgi:protoporphyrinogen oxidase